MRSTVQAQPIRAANFHGYGDWFKGKHVTNSKTFARMIRKKVFSLFLELEDISLEL